MSNISHGDEPGVNTPLPKITKIETNSLGGKVTGKLLVKTSPTTPEGTVVEGHFVWKDMGADGVYVIATVAVR